MKSVDLLKIVFTGAVGSGKSTAIHTVSAISTMAPEEGQDQSSVMDYGQLCLVNNEKIDLYGTLGSRKFDFMSTMLCEGALGLVILINNTDKSPFDTMEYYLNLNKKFLKKNPVVIAVTHCDQQDSPTLKHYCAHLQKIGERWPVMCIDPRKYEDVGALIKTLFLIREYG